MREDSKVDAELAERAEPPVDAEIVRRDEPFRPVTAVPPQIEPAQICDASTSARLPTLCNPLLACEESREFRVILLIGTITGCLLGNLLLPWFFWDSNRLGDRDRTLQLAFFASGGLTSQIGVLGLWCALGPQSFSWRFLVTAFLATVSGILFVVGLLLPDLPTIYLPAFTAMFLVGIGVVGFFLTAGVVALLSLILKERIIHGVGVEESSTRRTNNYSLGYLIGLTTAAAVLIALMKSIFPALDDERRSWPEILSVSTMLLQHAITSILMMLACAQLVLRTRHNWMGGVYIVAILLFVVPLNLALMQLQRRFTVDAEIVAMTLAYTLGFGFFCAFYMLLIRLAGYRLRQQSAPV